MTLEFSQQISEKSSTNKYHENPSSGRRVVPRGRTDTTKLLVAFRNLAIAPKLSERDGHYVSVTSHYNLWTRWPIFIKFRRNVRPLQATPTPYFTLPISNNTATCEPLTESTASGHLLPKRRMEVALETSKHHCSKMYNNHILTVRKSLVCSMTATTNEHMGRGTPYLIQR